MRTPEFGQIVATRAFILDAANGERMNSEIQIGLPYVSDDETWRCPVALTGLHGRMADATGADAVQALHLALSLVRQLLGYFVEDGGRILEPEDEAEWDPQGLDAILGPMKSAPLARAAQHDDEV